MEYSDDDGIILNVVKRSTSKTVGNNIALEDEHQILNKRKLK